MPETRIGKTRNFTPQRKSPVTKTQIRLNCHRVWRRLTSICNFYKTWIFVQTRPKSNQSNGLARDMMDSQSVQCAVYISFLPKWNTSNSIWEQLEPFTFTFNEKNGRWSGAMSANEQKTPIAATLYLHTSIAYMVIHQSSVHKYVYKSQKHAHQNEFIRTIKFQRNGARCCHGTLKCAQRSHAKLREARNICCLCVSHFRCALLALADLPSSRSSFSVALFIWNFAPTAGMNAARMIRIVHISC